MKGEVKFNGMEFAPVAGANYKFDYVQIARMIANKDLPEVAACRDLIMNDLFFIVYFVFKIPIANHPFIVQACRDVENGPKTHTLDVWARGHFKSTILTTAEPIQDAIRAFVLEARDERQGILSHTRAIGKSFLSNIKFIIEESEILKRCFPELFFDDPVKESKKWSLDDGLLLKTRSSAREASFEAGGLIEGMPTSKHYTKIIFDDVETDDLVQTQDTIEKCKHKYDIAQNLLSYRGRVRVVGTYYHHDATLTYIGSKVLPSGEKVYHVRKKPCTHDGTIFGKPVFLSERENEILKLAPRAYNTQQLLDPSPSGLRPFEPDQLIVIPRTSVPKDLHTVIAVDPAGDAASSSGVDNWAIGVVGAKPYVDDTGAPELYILDLVLSRMTFDDAVKCIVKMFLRHKPKCIGVERNALQMLDTHVSRALRSKGYFVSERNGKIKVLTPQGRNKVLRIQSNLETPFNSDKVHIVNTIEEEYIDTFLAELRHFPHGKDDGLDMLSWAVDMFRGFNFATDYEYTKLEKDSIIKHSDYARNRKVKSIKSWVTV